MINPWVLILFSLAYIAILFSIAYIADHKNYQQHIAPYKSVIYSLSLAVYCTSWTYYGAVGNASTRGWEYLAIYLGPIFVFIFAPRFLRRIAQICIENNITTISDFIASRYGKTQNLSVLVTIVAIMGTLPYIALQLKAIALSYHVITTNSILTFPIQYNTPLLADTGLIVACIMAVFSIIFGTRYANASEHHEGIILAIAFESLVKLFALIGVCVFAIYGVFDGPQDIIKNLAESETINQLLLAPSLSENFFYTTFISYSLLSAAAIFCLPRQFHVAFVEVDDTQDMHQSRWLFPLYLFITSIVVVPIAIIGLLLFEGQPVNPDMFVLTIPMFLQNEVMTLIVFIGGFSAATGMVIIAVITLSTMVCNDIVMPILFKVRKFALKDSDDITSILLLVRRVSIVLILLFSYFYYRYISPYTALSSIGLIAFVAAIQFAPAIIGGVYWKKATKQGATIGLIAGFSIWLYTLFLPTLASTGWISNNFVANGLWGIEFLKPHALFGFDQWNSITHALIFSLSINICCYLYFSVITKSDLIERIQAAKFTKTSLQTDSSDVLPWWSSVATEDLRLLAEKFIGKKAAKQAYLAYANTNPDQLVASEKADAELISFTENLLAGSIGASSAHLIISSVLRKQDLPIEDVFSIVDEASQTVHFTQELLNSTIEHIDQGIGVVDENLQMIAWNSRYLEIHNYPRNLIQVGRPMADILLHDDRHSKSIPEQKESDIQKLLEDMLQGNPHSYFRYRKDGTVLHIQGKPMSNVGYVVSFADVTELKHTEKELRKMNENLEKIVEGRTLELSNVNRELEKAIKSKNKFLTAVNHDVMQPLNAARLFNSALAQQTDDENGLIEKINNSIHSAEQIIHTLLDISKLDSGTIKTNISTFAINDVLKVLDEEFSVIAQQRNITFKCMFSSLVTKNDAHLIRRILQNFISNALKHTHPEGRVTIGCRRKQLSDGTAGFSIEVHDTGVGMKKSEQKHIFEEFKRLDNQIDDNQKGLGLGLAISKRISNLLNLKIKVKSKINRGSVFSLNLPISELSPQITQVAHTNSNDINDSTIKHTKILCIDNDKNIIDAMQILLGSWGCKSLCVTNCNDAIMQMKELDFTPQLLVVDYHLDEDNGIVVAQTLRKLFDNYIPAIVISADRSEHIKNEANSLNAIFLSKPVNPASLRKSIINIMQKSQNT